MVLAEDCFVLVKRCLLLDSTAQMVDVGASSLEALDSGRVLFAGQTEAVGPVLEGGFTIHQSS